MTDTITQAVERLRRLKAGEHGGDVYDAPASMLPELIRADYGTFADFLLSIWPKGGRPAAMETVGEVRAASELWWLHRGRVEQVQNPIAAEVAVLDGLAVCPTEAAARLELHWRKVLELVAMAEGAPKPE